jgi:hypothetical protein
LALLPHRVSLSSGTVNDDRCLAFDVQQMYLLLHRRRWVYGAVDERRKLPWFGAEFVL